MTTYPIADLHCDLLSFLADEPHESIKSPESRTSYPQMKEGGVAFQALTIFSKSDSKSHDYGKKQLDLLSYLLSSYSDKYQLWNPETSLNKNLSKPISTALVFENANSICKEDQGIESGLLFLEKVLERFKNILYISLTWDGENRFGGGCGSKVGLKEDGQRLLNWMSGKKIAVDLSHASDPLAEGILNHLDKRSLDIPVIASHSNARSVCSRDRNLPDFLAREVIQRKGLIGLNLFAPFVGPTPSSIADHMEYLFSLGGEKSLCFGADFFHLPSFPYVQEKYGVEEGFFPELANSSCYPKALSLLQKALNLSEQQVLSLSFGNVENYLTSSRP